MSFNNNQISIISAMASNSKPLSGNEIMMITGIKPSVCIDNLKLLKEQHAIKEVDVRGKIKFQLNEDEEGVNELLNRLRDDGK